MSSSSTIVGVVLAGGQSARMGHDKARIVIDGASLVTAAARRLAAVVDPVVIADRGRGTAPPFVSVGDAPARGPAAGVLGAAERYPGHGLLVLACDLPSVPTAFLALLASCAAQADLVIPEHADGRVEPLCACWGVAALAQLAERAKTGRAALHPVARDGDLVVRRIGPDAWRRFGDAEMLFRNLNTPDDLASWRGVQRT